MCIGAGTCEIDDKNLRERVSHSITESAFSLQTSNRLIRGANKDKFERNFLGPSSVLKQPSVSGISADEHHRFHIFPCVAHSRTRTYPTSRDEYGQGAKPSTKSKRNKRRPEWRPVKRRTTSTVLLSTRVREKDPVRMMPGTIGATKENTTKEKNCHSPARTLTC